MRALLLALPFLAAPAQAEEVIFTCCFDCICDPDRACQDAGQDIRFRVDLDSSRMERVGGADLSAFTPLIGDRGVATTTFLTETGTAVHSENVVARRDLTPMQFLGNCLPT